MTYKETKEMGCTDMVYWDNEPVINPKTGNEFFSPSDAKIAFQRLMAENKETIDEDRLNSDDKEQFEEVFKVTHYVNEYAPQLDDFIDDEERGWK